jgi:hypothetical protein
MGDGRSSGARRRTRAADCAVIDGELGALRPGGVAGIAMASLLIEAATPMLSQIFPLPPRSVWIGAYSHLPARSRWVRWFYSGTADLLRQSGNVTALCRPGLQRNCLFSGLRTASDADCGNRQACASPVQTIRSRLFPHTRNSGSLRPRHQQRRLRWNSQVIVINEVLVTRLKDIGGMKDPVGKVVRVSYPGYEGG